MALPRLMACKIQVEKNKIHGGMEYMVTVRGDERCQELLDTGKLGLNEKVWEKIEAES